MAIVRSSGKLSGEGGDNEYMVSSGQTVYFRILDYGDQFDFMTATAKEDLGGFTAYHDQPALMRHTAEVLEEKEFKIYQGKDRQERAFVGSVMPPDMSGIKHLAVLILDRLGITSDISVVALREMKEIHADLCVDDNEDSYMSDGMYVTPDGRVYER